MKRKKFPTFDVDLMSVQYAENIVNPINSENNINPINPINPINFIVPTMLYYNYFDTFIWIFYRFIRISVRFPAVAGSIADMQRVPGCHDGRQQQQQQAQRQREAKQVQRLWRSSAQLLRAAGALDTRRSRDNLVLR